jgi:hypothetical protein
MTRDQAQRLIAAFVLVAAGGSLTLALAQESTDGASAEGTVEVQEPSSLSAAEQVEAGDQIAQRGAQISRRVQVMLDQARRDRDIIRVTCLNDKLTQVNANLRTTEQRMESLRGAVDATDRDRGDHEYTVITVLGQKFTTLEQEANQCIGQDLYETGATRVTTEIDPQAPDEDSTQLPDPPAVDVPYIPPPASGII